MTSERDRLSKLSPLAYGQLRLPSRCLLSPLAGYTNLPFRRIVREIGGVGLATIDLVNARGLMDGSGKSLQLIESAAQKFKGLVSSHNAKSNPGGRICPISMTKANCSIRRHALTTESDLTQNSLPLPLNPL